MDPQGLHIGNIHIVSSVGVVRVVEQHRYVCAVEVGIHKEVTFPITIACTLKKWPDKVGELFASTYLFDTFVTRGGARTETAAS